MSIPYPNYDHTLSEASETSRGEFAAIERVRRSLSRRFPAVPPGETWIGDDCAVLGYGGGPLLFATDLTVAGVHGDLELVGLDDLGWKALAAALSDVAAMGGEPGHAVVGVAGPPSTDLDLLYEGIGAASAAHRCPVVGGDLSTADQLVVSVTVTGTLSDGPPPVLRSGANPGDTLLVTGPLGGSAAGLRILRERRGEGAAGPRAAFEPRLRAEEAVLVEAHRRPRARIEEGAGARRSGASAMIDVSDGLGADLRHLADASGVGLALEEVPVAAGATEEEALTGGEDYEIVFSVPDPGPVIRNFESMGLRPPLVIGRCTAHPSVLTLRGNAFVAGGFEHPWR